MTDELWFRRAVISAAAVLLVGLGGISALRLANAVAAPGAPGYDLTDLVPADFEKPAIPDADNAAAWLQAGSGAVKRSDEERQAVAEANLVPYEMWSPKLRAAVRESLDRHRGGLETLHMAAGLERSSYGIDYSKGVQARLPDLLDLLDAARLLELEARVALADGREQQTLTALATMTSLSRSLGEESTLITALVSIACERMQLTAAAEVAASGQPWVAGDLDQLEHTVSDADGATMIGRVFDAWAAVMEQHLNGLPLDATSDRGQLEASLGGVTRAVVADTRAELLRRLATPYGRDPAGLTASAPGTLLGTHQDDVGADMDGFTKAIGRLQSIQAQRQLVRAAIAMRREALEHGAYPAQRPAIGDLTGPDPFTGRRLLFQPQPDGSLVLALDGGVELLEQVIVKPAARTVLPIRLPAP